MFDLIQRDHFLLRNGWKWIGFVALAWVGCAPTEVPTYTAREEVKKIPAHQQKELAGYLTKFYGTPLTPLLRVAAEVDSSAEASKEPVLTDLAERGALLRGREVYAAQCQGCHGVTGDGNGPAAAYLDPKPRDYRKGIFKFTSTPRGRKPRQEDLVRIIRYGAKGTSMPAFRWMADEDMEPLIAYLKSLSSRGELEIKLIRESEDVLDEEDSYDLATVSEYANEIAVSWKEASQQIVLPTVTKVPYNDQTIELGARAFVKESCYKCHGIDGRGNPQNNVGKDDWGQVAFAANLANGMLHGGRRPLDIYRRIHSGINGTPMPGFGATLDSQGRPEAVWHLTHFITSIVEGRELPKELLEELAKEAEEAVKKQLQEANAAAKPEGTPATPPAETKPEEAKTEEAKPEDAKPKTDEAKPEEAKPSDPQPAETDEKKPVSESAEAQP
jgi:mono/diheme cytochrome c family protein